jgi:hypothetical protein
MSIATFELSYSGSDADGGRVNFYDVAEALIGFERSLALTVHLVLNDEIITQAPSLKGAAIYARPPEKGSWTFLADVAVVGTVLYKLGTAPKGTVLGHLVTSAYDYVVSEVLGFHVDFKKTLGQQYAEVREPESDIPRLTQSRLDSLSEKCEGAIKSLHRPISGERTANVARIVSSVHGQRRQVGKPLTLGTYEHIAYTNRSDTPQVLRGRVSSYNSNTFKGRVFVPSFGRPVPFVLSGSARHKGSIKLITASLALNALQGENLEVGYLDLECFSLESRSGVIKGLEVTRVSERTQ